MRFHIGVDSNLGKCGWNPTQSCNVVPTKSPALKLNVKEQLGKKNSLHTYNACNTKTFRILCVLYIQACVRMRMQIQMQERVCMHIQGAEKVELKLDLNLLDL